MDMVPPSRIFFALLRGGRCNAIHEVVSNKFSWVNINKQIRNQIANPLRPLDARSTLPVLARASRAPGLEVSVLLVRQLVEGRRKEDRPARGFSKKKP